MSKREELTAFTDKWIEEHSSEMVKSLQGLLKHRSVRGEAQDGAPFGKEIKDCLDEALLLSSKLGFKNKNLDGYDGIIDAGEGEECLGIMAHLDVVPESSGWSFPPYSGEISDGKIYGRGAIDNKGPAIASLYALKAVCESDAEFRRRVRIVLGCDEESGMRCLEYYAEHEEMPTMSFSPDADFPLSISEKSLAFFTIEKKYASNVSAASGEAFNIVPSFAEALIKTENGSLEKITTKGKAAHGSTPELGESAIRKLFAEMADKKLQSEDRKTLEAMRCFAADCDGSAAGLKCSDESGALTINAGMLRWNADGASLGIDIRMPISLTEEKLKAHLGKLLEGTGFEVTTWRFDLGFSLDENSELVSELLAAYRRRTGDTESKPMHLGGATYARKFRNAVSFGPKGYMDGSSVHCPDEYMRTDQLVFNAKLIAEAIICLACK